MVVQSFSPRHPSIELASRHDFPAFADWQLPERKELGYPPFGRLARILVQGSDEEKLIAVAREVGDRLKKSALEARVQVLGPAAAPISRIKDQFRWHILLKSPDPASLHRVLMDIRDYSPSSKTFLTIDVDPFNML